MVAFSGGSPISLPHDSPLWEYGSFLINFPEDVQLGQFLSLVIRAVVCILGYSQALMQVSFQPVCLVHRLVTV